MCCLTQGCDPTSWDLTLGFVVQALQASKPGSKHPIVPLWPPPILLESAL
jgi:hypothetical protein